jgi:hypothetical protein
MRIISWCAALGLGLIGATAFGSAGCSSDDSSTNNTTTDDAGPDSATVTDDGSTTNPDTGTTTNPDTGTTTTDDGGTDGGADGGTCSIGLDTGSADCDTCVAANCCTQLTTCDTPDDAGVDDAGFSSCEQLLSCINDANASADASADAGVGESDCNPSYTTDEQTNAEGVLTCIRTSCGTQCPGL